MALWLVQYVLRLQDDHSGCVDGPRDFHRFVAMIGYTIALRPFWAVSESLADLLNRAFLACNAQTILSGFLRIP